MAILWEKRHNGSKYQVRTAGKTRRLYTDGVCHTEYNPGRVFTRSVWDLLILPAFFYEPGTVKRILMLGIGGGAGILQLHNLIVPDEVVGVELDPMHLYIARRFFNIEKVNSARLYEDDAIRWVKEYDGPAFDMVIDDLFVEKNKEPVRAVTADNDWLKSLSACLSNEGVLVMNFPSSETFRDSAYFHDTGVSDYFPSAFQLTTPGLDNRVGVFLGIESNSAELRTRLGSIPFINQAMTTKELRYRIRQVS